jgi:hypothetical protein
MFQQPWRAIALAVLLLPVCVSAADEPSQSGRRAQIFATLPDWTGFWESEAWADITVAGRPAGGIAAVRAKSVLSAHPPYNAEWEKRYREAAKDVQALKTAAMTSKVCEFGFPGVLESPAIFQILVTPEETLLLFATREVRHVYTDGRSHPDSGNIWPTSMGHSVGRWDGDTLEISTVARLATAPLRYSSPLVKLSEQARFTERIRRAGPDRLENELTIEDPIALERPWKIKLTYRRVTGLDRMIHHDCVENDRNPVIDGKLTIAPPAPTALEKLQD